jgi:SET domain-containing protein
MKIYPPKKVYISKSPIHGIGVFASELIFEDEIIETTPIFDLVNEINQNINTLIDYRFNWPQGDNPTTVVLPWGYGCIYNHSDDPNANWRSNLDLGIFEFFAIKTIQPNEEICTWYGDQNYWNYVNNKKINTE